MTNWCANGIRFLRHIIVLIAFLLFSVLSAVVTPTAPLNSDQVEFLPQLDVIIANQHEAHFSARAPPTIGIEIVSTGIAVADHGNGVIMLGHETFVASLGFVGDLIATNIADDDFVDVYRAFGGDARAQGFSWTTVDPKSIPNFRDAAGLPSSGASGAKNTADFLLQGRANVNDIIKTRPALPLDGNKGGLPELIIDSKNVDLTDFSVLNP